MTMHFIRKNNNCYITLHFIEKMYCNHSSAKTCEIKFDLCNLLISFIPNSRDQKVSLLFYKPVFKRRQHMIWSPKVYIASTMSTDNILWKLQLILAVLA